MRGAMPPPVRFAVVGVNHNHIYAQTDLLLRAGAELVVLRGGGRPGGGVPASVPAGAAGPEPAGDPGGPEASISS